MATRSPYEPRRSGARRVRASVSRFAPRVAICIAQSGLIPSSGEHRGEPARPRPWVIGMHLVTQVHHVEEAAPVFEIGHSFASPFGSAGGLGRCDFGV